MTDETTTDHGFIRAWAEARDGRPGTLAGHASGTGRSLLRFDFGTPEPGLTEIAWDEFFAIFEDDSLALQFREAPGQLSRMYKFVKRDESHAAHTAGIQESAGQDPASSI